MAKPFDEVIFDPAFDLTGAHLVAASAGTGKTYNIQNIYLRLVVELGLLVGQIQVMTFTEAATQELRDRLRKALVDFSAFLAGHGEQLKQEDRARYEQLRDCLREGRGVTAEVASKRLELAVMTFDQAAISTIHGFCRRILTRFAFETRSAFGAELEDNKAATLTQAVRDWWRVQPKPPSFTLDALQKMTLALSGKHDWHLEDGEASPLLRQAAEIVQAYEAARPTRETQTFDDLLKSVREALCDPTLGPTLAAALRAEFKAALVDEFQDTDPVQYDIFRRVFLDPAADPKPILFFVGDPKQAIYAFRGGDIYTYRQAVRHPEVARETYCLNRNFRSTPRLIKAVNQLFRDQPGAHTFGDEAIAYAEDLRAGSREAGLQVPGQMPGVLQEDLAPFRIYWTTKASETLQAATVEQVLAVLREQPEAIKPQDIAILVPSHKMADGLCKMLRSVGVLAVLQQAGNVFGSAIALDLLCVLKALAGLGGARQIRAALATPFFAFRPEQLLATSEDSEVAEAIELLATLTQQWLTHGFYAAYAALEAHPLCKIRQRLAQQPDGERNLADLLQLVDLLGAALSQVGNTPERLVDWLQTRILRAEENSEKSNETYARQLESERDAVKIMTRHVSKGLEFKVTIIPIPTTLPLKSPYFYHEVADDGTPTLLASENDDGKACAQAEATQEQIRLLYVAFTRAIKRCIVIAKKGTEPLATLVANGHRNAQQDGEFAFAEAELEPDPMQWQAWVAPAVPTAALLPARQPRAFSALPTQGSYTSLSPSASEETLDARDVDTATASPLTLDAVNPIFSLAGGAKTGTCWHAILERLPFDASDEDLSAAVTSALRLYGLEAENPDRRAQESQLLVEMFRRTLDTPLVAPDGETFSLRQVSMAERLSEWAFDFSSAQAATTTRAIAAAAQESWADQADKALFLQVMRGWARPIPKGLLKGFIDLIFCHNGYYYVVDWKSNSLGKRREDFDTPGITEEMASAGYFFQYLLYAAVLHRFLKETLGPDYSWERNFGGIRYVFLRGIAAGGAAPIFADRPSAALLDRVGACLGLKETL
ncbi:MAG: UvrD-helicase domain-containing protein [Lentisphaeraceae bacterium]|nr:UvrD-helicase domain-containing protein [Lentisphaeraceae bacterium]